MKILPMLLLLFLAACTNVTDKRPLETLCVGTISEPEPTPEPETIGDRTYVRRAPVVAGEAGEPVDTEASCDPGDLAIGGGCTWGKARGDVEAFSAGLIFDDAEKPTGYACQGLARADGIAQYPVYGFVVCLAE